MSEENLLGRSGPADYERDLVALRKRVEKAEARVRELGRHKFTCKICVEESYQSEPRVNMTDDMVRVTLQMSIKEWRELKKQTLQPKEDG